MSNGPLVSIITPVYNMGNLLNETIQSVVDQTYENWELIVIDDCSDRIETKEIINSWVSKDKRIKAIFLPENGGAGIARNAGLERVSGEYVAFLDGDDVWLKDKLAIQIAHMRENVNSNFIFTWYETIDESGSVQNIFVTPKKISFNLLKFNNYILTSTVMCKWGKIRNLRMSTMRRRQDWSYFLDILNLVEGAHAIEKVTVQYRKMPNTLSSNRFKLIKPNYLFFKDYLYSGNSLLSILHFIVFLPFYFHNKVFNKKQAK